MVLALVMVLSLVMVLAHVMVLACVMVLALVMVLACDGWGRGSHGLSARRARRTKSSRPEGPKAGPKGGNLEVGARRAPRLLVCIYVYIHDLQI